MQPPSGQIVSGENSTPEPNATSGRTARMRTIQPLHSSLNQPNKSFSDVLAAQAKVAPQPLSAHLSAHPANIPTPAHDAGPPHPVNKSEPVTPQTQTAPASAPSTLTSLPTRPMPLQNPPTHTAPANPPEPVHEVDPLHASVPQPEQTLPPPIKSPAPSQPATNTTVVSEASAQSAAQTEAPKNSESSPTPAPPLKPESTPKSESATKPQPAAKSEPAVKIPTIQLYAFDKNEMLMRSSNPLAATLSGIELLIKRNGIVSIGYVSIFLASAGILLGLLYAAGRWLKVEFISINYSVLALVVVGILLIVTYLCSFIVCVASEAGQSVSLRQVIYLARKNLHKLLALQILTIVATFIGLLFGIIPGVVVLGRWMMAPFMIFESDHPSIMTAIKRSNKLTKGRTVEMTGLVFSQVLLLSTGLLGFAAMAAGPAARYQQLRLRLHDKTAVTKVHFLNYIMSFLLALSFLGGMTGAGYHIYKINQTICYSTIKFVSGKAAPVQVCVKRHICQRDIICRETLAE